MALKKPIVLNGGQKEQIAAADQIPVDNLAGGTASTGYVPKSNGDGTATWANVEASIVYVIDGGGAAIATGQKGHLEVPFNCTVNGWTIMSDVSGSIVVDVWKDTYANFPPTVADTIAGTEKPTLTSQQKNQDLSLTSFSTSLSKGDILAFNVDSVSTVARVVICFRVTKT